jgi:minor extracellular serine protease Vpr
MKKILLLLVLFPSVLLSQAPEISQKSLQDINAINRSKAFIPKDEILLRELPIMLIDNAYYVSFVGKLRSLNDAISPKEGVIIGQGKGLIRSVRIRLDKLDVISSLSMLSHLELAGKIKPYLNKALFDTRVDSVHTGLGLDRAYTGKNVLIGINDWGFDYTHPMLYDTLLQQTRIFAAWDQFKRSGPHPQGYAYGTEYATAAALLAAQTDTTNQLNHSTHGTHVAGIAGGSGAGVMSKGMAFEAQFLLTTILVDEAAVLDSWNWLYDKAHEAQKNLVVNMSWGLYHFGTSDGSSLLSQAITEYTDLGVLFVSSAGNNGGVKFHFNRTFNNDSIKSRITFYDYALHDSLWGQSIHGWGEVGKNFEVKIQVKQGITNIAETPYFSTLMNGYDEGFIVVNINDTIWYNIAGQSSHPQNGRPTVRFRIKNKHTNYLIDLVVRAQSGEVHFWNLVELTTNGGNWGQSFNSGGAGYIAGDAKYGIGEPSCAEDCLTVAAHISEYLHSNGTTLLGGARETFSSIGPLYSGIHKPDISGPGSQVISSISSFTTDTYTPMYSTTFNGRTYDFAKLSGTSMSSPAVAGICALIWEANPYLSPRQVKQIIMETARQDNKTGVISAPGSVEWGMGKVNARLAVKLALESLGLENMDVQTNDNWQVFPNPSSDVISINGLENSTSVHLVDASGKMISLDAKQTSWSVKNLTPGMYVIRVVSNNSVYQKKLTIF